MEEHSVLRGWLRLARANCNGREISLLPPLLTLNPLHLQISKPTLARSSMTSTRPHTPCSATCHRVITRSVPSTDLPLKLSLLTFMRYLANAPGGRRRSSKVRQQSIYKAEEETKKEGSIKMSKNKLTRKSFIK